MAVAGYDQAGAEKYEFDYNKTKRGKAFVPKDFKRE
jgi:hypothetical protein